jgi:ribonucleoside-diphosphate reductase alpha chain
MNTCTRGGCLMKTRGFEGLPQFSKDMYEERYFEEGEGYEEWLDRVTSSYADNDEHKERLKHYIKQYWFHPSTPIASNAGLPNKGLPISCYTNEVEDSKSGIFGVWEENNWLGSYGGGIGTTWSNVRGLGEAIGESGKSSGIIPFIKVSDSTTLAVSQGGLRRASQAVYLDVNHPEILEFIDIRRPTGDSERRSPNIHHGVTISDAFMESVKDRADYWLISPKTGKVVERVNAFDVWKKILISRVETGEPYLFFKDTANWNNPIEYEWHDRKINTSNLCSEIMLHTDKDTSGVCCLTSVNLEYFEEWKNDEMFLEDIHRYTDNVLQAFIDLTEGKEGFEKARKGAMEERSIGIGVMGYHSYLQSKNLPYQSLSATYLTRTMFQHIGLELEKSNKKLGAEKGTAELSLDNRNINVTSIAPTASISTLCNLSSPGIDPRVSNVYTAKTNIGSYTIKNKFLEKLIEWNLPEFNEDEGLIQEWIDNQWKSINKHQGSVQHLEWMSQEDKDVFKTSFEINQLAVIDNVSIMQEYITQGISCNVFIKGDAEVQYVHDIHMKAWEKGLKSLYYLRSQAVTRASVGNTDRQTIALEADTCLSCS